MFFFPPAYYLHVLYEFKCQSQNAVEGNKKNEGTISELRSGL